MNYLAHLLLGGHRPGQLLGSLYGDFVKGPLQGNWPPDVERSIRLHRAIDAFTDAHPCVRQGKARFPAPRRRFAGIVMDVFFDHCLARDWSLYSDVPLGQFTARVYKVLADEPGLPDRLAAIAPRMASQDWLGSYENFGVLSDVIVGMSRRLSKPEWLAGAYEEFEDLYEPLRGDFQAFFPELKTFAECY